VVVIFKLGVLKTGFVVSKLPPVGASYHWYTPPGVVAIKVARSPGQIVIFATVGGVGYGRIVMVTFDVIGPQGAGESLLVKESRTLVSPGAGVYVEVGDDLSEKVPLPPDHVTPDVPEKLPAS